VSRIAGEILIERPVEEVFDYVVDERNEPTYNRKMVRSQKLTEGPIGAGTRFAATMGGGRREIEMLVEYREVDRPRAIESISTFGAMTAQGTLRFEAVDGATRLSWDWELEPSGVVRFLSPVVALVGRRDERTVWSELKRVLEADG
jgi:uncharacterized protein YndB with AHSA1/START domain